VGDAAGDPAVRSSALPRTDLLLFDTRPGRPFAEPRLRKAVALAVDRSTLARMGGPRASRPVDHLLPATIPGYRPARIFPLRASTQALERARTLARGLVPAKVTLGVSNRHPWPQRGVLIAQSLGRIGLEVEVKVYTRGACFRSFEEDIMQDWWEADHLDPGGLFRYFLERTDFNGCGPIKPGLPRGWAERYEAANRLPAGKRLRAFGALDLALTRDGVPAVALFQPNELNLFSARIGCFRPHRVYQVSLGSLCLRR
jgi:ABC-type transport system substrate-binding protein